MHDLTFYKTFCSADADPLYNFSNKQKPHIDKHTVHTYFSSDYYFIKANPYKTGETVNRINGLPIFSHFPLNLLFIFCFTFYFRTSTPPTGKMLTVNLILSGVNQK